MEGPVLEYQEWRSSALDTPTDLSSPPSSFELNMLTPPSSAENAKKRVRWADETPRSTRTALTDTLPRELDKKCHISVYCDVVPKPRCVTPPPLPAIKEETTVRENLKRSATDLLISPRKKLRFDSLPPRKLSSFVCPHQKENSPIKVEISSQDCPLLLKRPTLKCTNLCCNTSRPKDILSALASRNMYRIIQDILTYLPPLDLVNVSQVSKSWQRICGGVVSGELVYGKQMALISKENLSVVTTKDLKGKRQSETNSLLKDSNEKTPRKNYPFVAINKLTSPKRRLPETPELSPKSKRFCYYVKEGKMLDKTEQLIKCPKCIYPAKFVPSLHCAECSFCGHRFCEKCRCAPHQATPCNFVLSLSPSPVKSVQRVPVGSKSSKKSLRRL